MLLVVRQVDEINKATALLWVPDRGGPLVLVLRNLYNGDAHGIDVLLISLLNAQAVCVLVGAWG